MSSIQRTLRDPGVLWVFLPICILMLSIAAWLFFTGRAERIALQRMELKAADALQVQSEAVMNQLEKYRFIPAILARRSPAGAGHISGDAIACWRRADGRVAAERESAPVGDTDDGRAFDVICARTRQLDAAAVAAAPESAAGAMVAAGLGSGLRVARAA